MDRSTKDFQAFVLLLDGCFRAYSERLAAKLPKDSITGRSDPNGVSCGIDPAICRAALRDGNPLPTIFEFRTVAHAADTTNFHGEVGDSARILGRIEKAQRCEIPDLFARWLSAERRRDTASARLHFVDAIARRILGVSTDPLPGARPSILETDQWRDMMLDDPEAGSFSRAAAEVFTAAGEASNATYPPSERFTDLLLGGRLCGHVEGLAHFPMREIVKRFSGKSDPDVHAVLAGEFGRAIATSAVGQPNLWTSSTDAIVPGLHEHLAQVKATHDPERSSVVPACGA